MMHKVRSTNIKEVGYNPATKELHILFKTGSLYKYSNVSPAQHASFMAAESPGKHFLAHIKSHKFEKLT